MINFILSLFIIHYPLSEYRTPYINVGTVLKKFVTAIIEINGKIKLPLVYVNVCYYI